MLTSSMTNVMNLVEESKRATLVNREQLNDSRQSVIGLQGKLEQIQQTLANFPPTPRTTSKRGPKLADAYWPTSGPSNVIYTQVDESPTFAINEQPAKLSIRYVQDLGGRGYFTKRTISTGQRLELEIEGLQGHAGIGRKYIGMSGGTTMTWVEDSWKVSGPCRINEGSDNKSTHPGGAQVYDVGRFRTLCEFDPSVDRATAGGTVSGEHYAPLSDA